MADLPATGEVVWLGRPASVQFAARPIALRVIKARNGATCDGWVWLDGYQLDEAGSAVERRSVFVQIVGIQRPSAVPIRRRGASYGSTATGVLAGPSGHDEAGRVP